MRLRWLVRLLMPYGKVLDQADAQPRAPLTYPAQITLGGTTLIIRLLEPGDRSAVLAFARSLPAHDLLFLRRDITRPEQVDLWLRDVAEGLLSTVVAVTGGEIVGYATVASEGLTWTRHVREIRVLVAPSMRGKRLGRLLIEQAFAIARQQGVKKMVAQMTTDQRAAIAVFQSMGFEREARLHKQVMDREGALHDLQIMGLEVDAFQAKLDVAIANAERGFS